ncbi:hypothetical protein CR194_10650 [Salipaludibacillus keqinensis]|uniref:Metallo-beta-lactamase domain-containing protein n=1 Tax=Salipaludibacillus keqinensis TaxID=2045207 RepID=A0A323TF41_9BACI|nr:MBL fold metallo-hydrolase [Salipaludibacillus keqinensis]PYZ93611.1 hypothetical protein CR194_10650 [Salipaludibacillus keqinensis]
MKLTVIGFWGAYAGKNEATSCFLIEEENTKILLDCGSGAVSQLQNYVELKELDAVVLSHYHHDHVADLGGLTYSRVVDMNLKRTDHPLQIYAHGEDKNEFQKLGKPPYSLVTQYEVAQPITIGPFSISFQKTSHPAPCFAMKITSTITGKSVVYTADTTYDQKLVPFSIKADLLLAETSFYADQTANTFGHMNSDEVGRLANEAKVEAVMLTHLPHFGNHQQLVNEVSQRYQGQVILAKTGEQMHI